MPVKISCWLILALALAGCQQASPPAGPQDSPNATSSGPDPSPRLRIASWEQTQQLIAEQQGKVVVLDIWSSWCIPCIREFPHLVELHRQYPDQVACISLNVNYSGLPDAPPESHREQVLQFLTEQQATFENIISSDPDTELYEKLDLASIPAVLVYDRQGNLSRRFDNEQAESEEDEFNYDRDIVPLVEQLLQAAQ